MSSKGYWWRRAHDAEEKAGELEARLTRCQDVLDRLLEMAEDQQRRARVSATAVVLAQRVIDTIEEG